MVACYVCANICACACVCACMHVCKYACVHVCTCARVPVCTCACVPVCLCACVPVCVCACVRVHVWMRVFNAGTRTQCTQYLVLHVLDVYRYRYQYSYSSTCIEKAIRFLMVPVLGYRGTGTGGTGIQTGYRYTPSIFISNSKKGGKFNWTGKTCFRCCMHVHHVCTRLSRLTVSIAIAAIATPVHVYTRIHVYVHVYRYCTMAIFQYRRYSSCILQ